MPHDTSLSPLIAGLLTLVLIAVIAHLLTRKKEQKERREREDAAAWSAHQTLLDAAVQNAYQTVLDAEKVMPDEAGGRLLAAACEQCARIIHDNPRHVYTLQLYVYALHLWGTALMKQARQRRGKEAQRLYREAEEKYASALALKPDDSDLRYACLCAALGRAGSAAGEEGRIRLETICKECERLAALHPRDIKILGLWGSALATLNPRVTDAEACRTCAEADQKFASALELDPDDNWAMVSRGFNYITLARLQRGEADHYWDLAGECLEAVLRKNFSDEDAFAGRAFLLFDRLRYQGGEAIERQVAEAARLFEKASRARPSSAPILEGWGVILNAQSKCAEEEERAPLLREACKKLTQSESLMPSAGAYDLGCVHAQLGEIEECRKWLETSGEQGILVRRQEMATEPDLARVRDCEWFQAMLERN